jgi:hypothetical protein
VSSARAAFVSRVRFRGIEPAVEPTSYGNILRISEIGFDRRDNNASTDLDQLDPG